MCVTAVDHSQKTLSSLRRFWWTRAVGRLSTETHSWYSIMEYVVYLFISLPTHLFIQLNRRDLVTKTFLFQVKFFPFFYIDRV